MAETVTDLLRAVREHAAMRRAVDADFREAVRRARERHTLAAIGDAAGMSRQGIHSLLRNVDQIPERGGDDEPTRL